MGWDHHAGTPDLDPSNILNREVFTLQDLIDRFDIQHVNHKRAAVDLSKLDYLNKMHLRRIAGGNGRDQLIGRFQALLRESKVLHGWYVTCKAALTVVIWLSI